MMTVELRSDQWDAEPPECPQCAAHDMGQIFKPPAIGGSNSSRAHAVAEDIMANDYNVADFKSQGPDGGPPKVRYKDAISTVPPSTWGAAEGAIAQAISLGRETRLKHGSGLDVLQTTLKNGTQPDLIELSKKRSMRVW